MKNTVLFVDDEENVLKALRRLMMAEDFEVFIASSGPAGLEVLKQHEVPVIVSDQRMPGMTGAEFLQEAKQLAPESMRIILTGYADVTAAIDAINRGGAYRYITKPWNDGDLVLVIRDALEKYHLIRENRRLTDLTLQQNEELKKWSAELEYSAQKHDIEHTRRNKEIKQLTELLHKTFSLVAGSLYSLIELREGVAGHHSSIVAVLAGALAERMKLPASEVETITIAGRLHDIGKLCSTDSVFFKDAAALTAEERDDYLKHPARGQALIDFAEELRPVGVLIRHHHEAFNGGGFPDRLKGDLIPLGSRIIAMADRFDRISRQPGHSAEQALGLMRARFLSQMDPALFGVFSETVHAVAADQLHEGIAEQGTALVERETPLNDLLPGMVLARTVRSVTGLLLLDQDTALNAEHIETLRRHDQLAPFRTGLFIRGKAGTP